MRRTRNKMCADPANVECDSFALMVSSTRGAPWRGAILCVGWLLAYSVGCPAEDGGLIVPPPPPPSSGAGGRTMGLGGAGGEGGEGDPECAQQPCKLVPPQCGCNIGRRCVHSAAGEPYCTPVGGKPATAACDNDCLAAHVCADNGTGAPPMCHRYCLADTDCIGDGSRCILNLAAVEENLCTASCDAIAQTGCVAEGTKCDVGTAPGGAYSHCTGVGLGVQGDLCTTTSECDVGLTCTSVNAGPLTCYTLCDVDAAICPTGTGCNEFATALTIGPTEYGICI